MVDKSEDVRIVPYAVPSDRAWFDPLLLTLNTSIEISAVAMGVGLTKAICAANARRWAIGMFSGGGAGTLKFAPWPDIANGYFLPGVSGQPFQWYTLWEYGPLVCSQWWGTFSGGGNLRVVELIRN